jgi:hypothetical protein
MGVERIGKIFRTQNVAYGGLNAYVHLRWINQNNFYRQIRNFVLDMRNMPNWIEDGPPVAGEQNHPAGIHWQVSQACTLQNIDFIMPTTSDSRHIGIFQENGSGGFVSNLFFNGGKIGWVAGSQQYTARDIKFRGCRQGQSTTDECNPLAD